MNHTAATLFAAACLAAPLAATAEAPAPTKPVSTSFFSGKWYEIARLPTKSQRNCEASFSQFTGATAQGDFKVTQSCRVGAVNGPLRTVDVSGKIMPGGGNAKFELTFYRVVKQEYWVIDRSESLDWAIMGTPGGNYVWVMSRKPVMAASDKAAVVSRLKAAGYPVEKLVYPKHPAS